MCGLAAIYAYRDSAPPVDGAELERINRAMHLRGPDDEGTWFGDENRVGLAHRRLAVQDPGAAGHQPMVLKDDNGDVRLAITYNGEIYNFGALRAQLEAGGHIFETGTDTEVLLHLYDRHGRDMLGRLRGMYAFAIWDRDRRGLWLARDPFGIKPLYFADDGSTIRVASQVKALMSGGAIASTVDPAAHVGFFLLGYVPEPLTLTKEICALSAGTHLWINDDGPESIRQHFSISDGWVGQDELQADDRAESLREALAESVSHHLVSDVPVGVFLSAGLDSATVAALAAESSGTKLQTITLAFDEYYGTERDEAPLAERLAAGLAADHRTVRVAGGDFKDEYRNVVAAMDQPSIDGVNTYFVAKSAADAGLKVALSGVGGDELFGGYNSFQDVPRLVRSLGRIPGIGALGSGFRMISGPLIGRMVSPKYAGLLEYSTSYGSAYLLRRGLFMPWELPSILDPDLAREGWNELGLRFRLDRTAAPHSTPTAKVAALEMSWYMRNQLLRDADWAGMAHSVEIRTPLVDATLFQRVRASGAGKLDMAGTPRPPLPDDILSRAKTGFHIPVQDWLADAVPSQKSRGLRGWAGQIYREFTNDAA